ncbi:MAG: single-stranded DNA-binding protein [Bacteroidales bacterium]|nr:single-stranded DNA-binding protein [Bacteroidales bacterium]
MLNHITIMGRLTRDPELRRTASGVAVTSFTIACDRDFNPKDGSEKETDFIDCNAWRNTAEFVAKHFSKGSMAVVSGRLQIRNWTDKEGNKRRNAEVVADSVYFGDSKKSEQGNSTYQAPNSYPGSTGGFTETEALINQYQQQGVQSDFAMLEDEDDPMLPF